MSVPGYESFRSCSKASCPAVSHNPRFTGFALAGMLVYPFFILLASVLGFDKAASLITDVASVYVLSASAVVGAFMGFNAYSAKSNGKSASVKMENEQ